MQCKLVSSWGLRKQRSAPPYGPYGSGRTLRIDNTLCPFFFSSVSILSSMSSFPHAVTIESSMRSCPSSIGCSMRYGWLQQRRSSAIELRSCTLTTADAGCLLSSSLLNTFSHSKHATTVEKNHLKKAQPDRFWFFGGLNPGFIKRPKLMGFGVFIGFQLLEWALLHIIYIKQNIQKMQIHTFKF